MARPIQYDRQSVLDAATHLFWRRGYEGVTLGEVLTETGFNRHSLYREFGGKDGLFTEALANYRRLFHQSIGAPLRTDDGLSAVRALFERRLPADLDGRGCFATNTLVEREAVCPEACEIAGAFLDDLRGGLAHAIRAGQAKGEVRADRDADALAEHVLTTIQGLGVMGRLGIDEGQARRVADQTLDYLAG